MSTAGVSRFQTKEVARMSQGQRSVTLDSMEELGFMSSDVCRKIQEILTLEVLISSESEKSGRNVCMCVFYDLE